MELYPSVSSKEKENQPYIQRFNNNPACIARLMHEKFPLSTRQVGVTYLWIKEIIEKGEAEMEYIRTDEMVANGPTAQRLFHAQ